MTQLTVKVISDTFGVSIESLDKIILVEMEDGKAVNMIPITMAELTVAVNEIAATLHRINQIMEEGKQHKPN